MALECLVVADDLSGACEAAAAALLRTTRIEVHLQPSPLDHETRVLVLDTDTRGLSAADAGRTLGAIGQDLRHSVDGDPDQSEHSVPSGHGATAMVVLKIDSLLRGPVGASAAAFGRALDRPLVVATALPQLRRTVLDGVPLIEGVPLAETSLWRAEGHEPPRRVADVLAPLTTVAVPLATVRGPELHAALTAAHTQGLTPVCDAETDADLEALARASATIVPHPVLVGTAALVRAVAADLPGDSVDDAPVLPHRSAVLAIVGTHAPVVAEQLDRARAAGASVRTTTIEELLVHQERLISALEALPRTGLHVLAIDPDEPSSPELGARLSAALLDAACAGAGDFPAVMATGGQTARGLLERWGTTKLLPRGELGAGTVVSTTPDHKVVVTRPGSFGGVDGLADLTSLLDQEAPSRSPSVVRRVDQPTPESTSSTRPSSDTSATTATTATTAHAITELEPQMSTALPRIAVTMGDAAGIGPEIIVKALADPVAATLARSVVIGDAARLRAAAELTGTDVDIVTVEDVEDAEEVPGRINVIDLGLIPDDLPFGVLSAVAGDAAFHYIRVAAELAVAGRVQAICTAPLNKEALHAGGHKFPGHTEMLAHLTETPEVSMMLSTEKVKVIHVTTHIGLLDAVRKIEPGLVERVIRRGHQALVDAGVPHPKIGVCGINPHAGENGLFGHGEEEEKINPAVEVCRADGIDVHGALPADTLFFLAGRGDYDLVVAMYHDQGHGPVKVLGLEAGVNVTIGLPVIRTSVDHGTAFDIAGKGIADHRSMIEALRLGAEMAPAPVG